VEALINVTYRKFDMVNDNNNPESKSTKPSDDDIDKTQFKPEQGEVPSLYSKKGKLEDLDIHSLLKELKDDRYNDIKRDEPIYYLRLIRKNVDIPEDLRKLAKPEMMPMIEALCREIDAGNWSAISHHYMRQTYPHNPELHDIRVKDMLFYAFAANRISLAEFGTAHMVLNIKEQYGLEIGPEYGDKALLGKGVKSPIPAQLEEFEMHPLFDEDSKLTTPGIAYLNDVVANVEELYEEFREQGVPVEFDREVWFDNLKKYFQETLQNLQMFFKINNSLSIEHLRHKTGNSEGFWQSMICAKKMPLFAAPDRELRKEIGMDINKHIYSPSLAVVFAFLTQLRSEEIVKPVLCVGNIGGRELGVLHKARLHIVAILDDRAKSNHISPHGHKAGALYIFIHDVSHCMFLLLHTQMQRNICCETFPNAIDKSVAPKDKFEAYLADRMIEAITDLPSLVPQVMNPEHFLEIGFKGAAIQLQDDLFPKEEFFDFLNADQKKNKTIAFLEKCLKEIKNTRPEGLSWESLGQNQSWEVVENCLDEIRNFRGKASVLPIAESAASPPTNLAEGSKPADKKSRTAKAKEKVDQAVQKAKEWRDAAKDKIHKRKGR